MPTPSTTAVKRLPGAYPVEVTYVAGVDGQGDDVVERAGTAWMVEMVSPDGDTITVTDKDARHNLVPLGWRAAAEVATEASAKSAARTTKEHA